MNASAKMIALIPARSGSKRLADKNIYPLDGHSLLAYAIAGARASGVFSRVVVSTDSEVYAEIAMHYGADVPFLRPAAIAGEHSLDFEWVDFTLRALEQAGESYDGFSILRPTSPFRQAATIRRAWAEFSADPAADSIRAVEKCKQHPGKMWVLGGQRMQPLLPQDPAKAPMHSSQYASLPAVYVQNASLEMARRRVIFEDRSIAGRVVRPFFTQGFEGVDINESKDLWYVEHLLQAGSAELPPVIQTPYRAGVKGNCG